jgi:hypothetical protein
LINTYGPPDGLYVQVLEWDDGTLIKPAIIPIDSRRVP